MLRLVVSTAFLESDSLVLIRPTTAWLKRALCTARQCLLVDSHHPHRPTRLVGLASCVEQPSRGIELRFAPPDWQGPPYTHFIAPEPPPEPKELPEKEEQPQVYEGMAARAVAAGKRRRALAKKAKMQERMAAVRACKPKD